MVAKNPTEARAQALRGRDHVCATWQKEKVFRDLRQVARGGAV